MSGIFLADLKYQVAEPSLVSVGLMTTAGLNLVTGTALAESAAGASGLVQHPGPALGLWQMEPEDCDDIFKNFLPFNPTMASQVQAMLGSGDRIQSLVTNLLFAAAMCRIHYWRAPSALPAWNDAKGLAAYWKAAYNSSLGAGVVDVAHVAMFQAAIDA